MDNTNSKPEIEVIDRRDEEAPAPPPVDPQREILARLDKLIAVAEHNAALTDMIVWALGGPTVANAFKQLHMFAQNAVANNAKLPQG